MATPCLHGRAPMPGTCQRAKHDTDLRLARFALTGHPQHTQLSTTKTAEHQVRQGTLPLHDASQHTFVIVGWTAERQQTRAFPLAVTCMCSLLALSTTAAMDAYSPRTAAPAHPCDYQSRDPHAHVGRAVHHRSDGVRQRCTLPQDHCTRTPLRPTI